MRPVTQAWSGVETDLFQVKPTEKDYASVPCSQQTNPNAKDGSPYAIYGVYDGHGGRSIAGYLEDLVWYVDQERTLAARGDTANRAGASLTFMVPLPPRQPAAAASWSAGTGG